MKILIAEDDEDIRSLLREVLEDQGHRCDVAEDGSVAQRFLEAGNHYELLISDYRMPHTDGLGLLHWCREKQIQLPVILLTASRVAFARDAISLSGCASKFLRKPVNMDDLVNAVNALA